jgi:hypothetical protein
VSQPCTSAGVGVLRQISHPLVQAERVGDAAVPAAQPAAA